MTTILITFPDGGWFTRQEHDFDVLLAMTLGHGPMMAAERIARFSAGQAVPVGSAMWRMR